MHGLLGKVNPLSISTEAVEHFHSLSHRKCQVQTVREYIQSWAVIVRECTKSMCLWSFQLFSGHKSSYYFHPEKTKIALNDIPRVPKLETDNKLSDEDNIRIRNLCKEFKALPQASTRAFTSKFKAGTLPLQAYATEEKSDSEDGLESDVEATENGYIDENPEYDSSSSIEDEELPVAENEEESLVLFNQNVVTRSGRKVVPSKRFIFD